MKGAFWLYRRYAVNSVRAQMQYKFSFITEIIGHFMVTIIEFFGVIALFERFGSLAGWVLPEVALLYGLVNMTFALADMICRGFDLFGRQIKTGDFDRLLLRPRSTVLQLLGYEFTLKRFGRLSQALLVFIWALGRLTWHPLALIVLVLAMAGGIALFISIYIIQAALAFRTVESLEIMNTLTYGGNFTAQYPMSVYRDWFRIFFTFIVPLACVCYFPVITFLGKHDIINTPLWLGWVSPVSGFVFLYIGLQVWKLGILHYTSTGT